MVVRGLNSILNYCDFEEKKFMVKNTDLAKMLSERFHNQRIENIPEHISRLKTAKDMFDKIYDLKSGDLVVWKESLKNKIRPALNEPAIVMEILESPLRDMNKQDAGSAYFNEPLDLLLGLINEDGDFVIFYYDKRRFKPYQE